jgi:hypothetical protein
MSAVQILIVCSVEIAVCTVLLAISTVYLVMSCRVLRDLQRSIEEPVAPRGFAARRTRGKHEVAAELGTARFDSMTSDGAEWTGEPTPYTRGPETR